MPPIGESLDGILTDGPKNLRAQVIRAWSTHQAYTGPWIIRAETRLSGESWKVRWKGEITADQTRTSATAGQIMTEIKRNVTEGHGPSPYCDLRFICYRQGHSKDADAIDVTRVVRPVTEGDLLPAQLDPGLAVAFAQQGMELARTALHEQAAVIASLSAQNAALAQHHASLATTRAVGSTSADIGTSIMSFAAGGALVMLWPKIRQKLGLKDDDEVIDVLVEQLRGQTARVEANTARDVKALSKVDDLPVFDVEAPEPVPALPGDPAEGETLGHELEEPDADPVLPADVPAEVVPTIDPDAIRAAVQADPEAAAVKIRELLKDPALLDALKVGGIARSMINRI